MQSGCNKPRNMRDVGHQHTPRLIGNLAEFLEIENPGIRACANDDELRLVFEGETPELFKIDLFGLLVHTVMEHIVKFP